MPLPDSHTSGRLIPTTTMSTSFTTTTRPSIAASDSIVEFQSLLYPSGSYARFLSASPDGTVVLAASSREMFRLVRGGTSYRWSEDTMQFPHFITSVAGVFPPTGSFDQRGSVIVSDEQGQGTLRHLSLDGQERWAVPFPHLAYLPVTTLVVDDVAYASSLASYGSYVLADLASGDQVETYTLEAHTASTFAVDGLRFVMVSPSLWSVVSLDEGTRTELLSPDMAKPLAIATDPRGD